jgi:predicted membrane-bound spermidine synthase
MSQTAPLGLQTKLAKAPPRWVFFAIFAISGFSGLIYESIWSHYLKLFLGHAAYAQSLVLMIFMGGLALGSWLSARFSERFRLPILVYALVEGVIGVIALLFHSVFVSVSDAFYFSLLPALDAPVLAGFLKWGAAAALIVPQSVLLGMTFPLMTTGILRRYPDHPGGSLSMLYFTNSIGAAIGVLVSGFWLIGVVGLPGAIMTAGLLNIALALVVFMLVRLDPAPDSPPIRAPSGPTAATNDDGLAVLFFVAAGITGAASFIYEIGWIRMLSLVLGATTHSFELMLSAFITGLALGGLWIKRRIDAIANPVVFAGWVQVVMGVMAILTVPLYVQTFDWMAALLSGLQRSGAGYNLFTAASHGIALVVMVPTTFLAGMTLPLFTHVLMRGRQGEQAIGRIYAANTLGAIVGVLFAVHVGLPLLGLKSLIGFGAGLDILLGLVLLYKSRERGALAQVFRGALVGASTLVLIMVAVDLDPKRLASGVYRYSLAQWGDDTQILYYKDGKTASISLAALGSEIAIATNGKPDASIQMDPELPRTSDEITMVMAAALPLAYHPGARQVANIGLGSGLTTHTLLADHAIEHVDTIEIEAAMIEAAQGFGERVTRAFTDPRSSIHLEDAKTFFSLHNGKYDAIIAEPSNPWVSGVASLFSEEFYRTVPNYLNEDGVLVQWLQLYEFDNDLAFSVLRALSQNFSDYVIYNTDNTNILIVAKPVGTLDEPSFERVFSGAFGAEAAGVGLHGAEDLLVRKTGTAAIIKSWLAQSSIPANSDYFPFLDLNAGKARFLRQVATLFGSWSVAPLPLLEMIGVSAFEHGKVMANERFERTMMIDRARAIHAVFSTGDEPVDASELVSLGPTMTTLGLLQRSCESQLFEESWLRGLHTMAESTLAFLDGPAATEMLRSVLPSGCREQSSERLLAWYDLYRRIAERDANGMAVAAEAVLEKDRTAAPSHRLYALAAAMLGHLCAGHPEKTLALWDTRNSIVGDMGATPPDLELIVTLALAASQQGASHR